MNAEPISLYHKVVIEVDGVPAHAWDLDTVSKLLAPQCWIERLDEATSSKADMSTYKVTAWTLNPAFIPTAKRLLIAEAELPVVYSDPPINASSTMLRRTSVRSASSTTRWNSISDASSTSRRDPRLPSASPPLPMTATTVPTATLTAPMGSIAVRRVAPGSLPFFVTTVVAAPTAAAATPVSAPLIGRGTRWAVVGMVPTGLGT